MPPAFTDPGVAAALARFPEDAAIVRRLAAESEWFRETSEHLALARRTLAAFETRPDARERPEIADYRIIIADFESELARLVAVARDGGPRG